MPLTHTTLANELKIMVPVATETEGIANWSTAWENYFNESTVLGISVTPNSLVGAITSMKAAMVGINSAPNGCAILQAGIVAFWNTVIASAPTIWVTTPLIMIAMPPPNLTTIATTLEPIFAANISNNLDIESATAAVAEALHSLQLGGIATMTPPPSGVYAPIL